MSGNVWEWCWDRWNNSATSGDETYTQAGVVVDPLGATGGSKHVGRGGSWDSYAYSCAVSCRNNHTPDFCNFNLGFRLVRSL